MALRLSKVLNKNYSSIKRLFEPMGEGLILITIECDSTSSSPYRWFLEDSAKPPLDIAIQQETGRLESITFFLQDERVKEGQVDISCQESHGGIPVFDVSYLTQNGYHIFEQGHITPFISGNSICFVMEHCFAQTLNVGICVSLSEDIALFFDNKKSFIGFIIKNLLGKEIEALRLSKVIKGV